jgi:hypothetical protein
VNRSVPSEDYFHRLDPSGEQRVDEPIVEAEVGGHLPAGKT